MSDHDLGYILGYILGIGFLVLLALIVVVIVKRPSISFSSGGRRRHRSTRGADGRKDDEGRERRT